LIKRNPSSFWAKFRQELRFKVLYKFSLANSFEKKETKKNIRKEKEKKG